MERYGRVKACGAMTRISITGLDSRAALAGKVVALRN
jgi:hypothetical protein